jgi:para-aminobenzoate synthetase component 1
VNFAFQTYTRSNSEMETGLKNTPPFSLSPSAEHAKRRLNELGKRAVPFLFLADFELKHPEILPLTEIDPSTILFKIGRYANCENLAAAEWASIKQKLLGEGLTFQKHAPGQARYQAAFAEVMGQIRYGNSFLCNLTLPTPVDTNLTLREVFHLAAARYKVWYRDQFVVFSPECFVQVRGQQIATYPMKGTIRADLPGAERTILADRKEQAEHATIVDLLRNDLSMVAERVRVARYRYVERVRTHTGGELLQVSSEVVGDLPPGHRAHLGDLLFSLLPAGSICGAPKPKTLDIIAQAEGQPRGWYTGICAVYDGQDLDSGVMIRFLENAPGQPAPAPGLHRYQFRSGGGITHLSEATAEYDELLAKVYLPIPPDALS